MTQWIEDTHYEVSETREERALRLKVAEALDWLNGMAQLMECTNIDRHALEWHIEEMEHVLKGKGK